MYNFCSTLHTNRSVFSPFPTMFIWATLNILSADAFSFDQSKVFHLEKGQFVQGSVENIVGKGDNAGYQHFHHFP